MEKYEFCTLIWRLNFAMEIHISVAKWYVGAEVNYTRESNIKYGLR